jgi:hypothetical protein
MEPLVLSPMRKVQLITQLYQTAWLLKKAGLKKSHPDWTEARLEKAVRDIFLYARS